MREPDFAEGVAALRDRRPPDFADPPGPRGRGSASGAAGTGTER